MIKIALDALGGDYAPDVVIDGAIRAVKEAEGKLHIVLCGPQEVVEQGLKKFGYEGDAISIVDAPEPVAMDDHPVEVLRKKPNSGLVTCVALQKKGLVQASVSAGNSGAMMASCLMLLGRTSENFARPPIGCIIPTAQGQMVMVDAGANVDEKAPVLVDFALAGSVFAECYLGIENPKVALLNMGEEEKKGPAVIQEAYQLLKNVDSINFIGNIEGREVLLGGADVLVCSGYTGNIVLKMIEGFYILHHELFGSIDTPAGHRFDETWDYRNAGGALLLGLNGTGLIAHGISDAKAIHQACLAAYRFASNGVAKKIGEKLSGMK
ncbi:MAG: phosphate acyltransferase PlsX [Fibrobacteraceae bacterium]|nr:phosphate acyltransferase PlsX [Fibrobacteraceae bacterium]